MTNLFIKCKFCGKSYDWRGPSIFSDVVDHFQVLRCFFHIVFHHWREVPNKCGACWSAFKHFLFLLLYSVLFVLRVLSFALYPLYWVLSLLFE